MNCLNSRLPATGRTCGSYTLLHASSGRTTLSIVPPLDYIHVTDGEPHGQRARQMLAVHPELRELAGPTPSTAAWVLLLVVAQLGLAVLVGERSWMIWVP